MFWTLSNFAQFVEYVKRCVTLISDSTLSLSHPSIRPHLHTVNWNSWQIYERLLAVLYGIKQGFSLASWTLNERRLNEWMATFHYYKHEFKGSWNTTFKHKASKYGMFRRPTYQTPIISLGNLIHFEWNRRVCEKALLVKFYAKLSLLCAKRDQPRFERSENRVWSVAPSLLLFLPHEHPSYTVSYARLSVRTWFVPTLHSRLS